MDFFSWTRGRTAGWLVAGCLATSMLVGCRTAPMLVADTLEYPAAGADAERIRTAIVSGARRAGWNAETLAPGVSALRARYTVRPDVYAVVRIDYGEGRIAFRYLNSSNFRCTPGADGCERIHRRYNKGLLRLREEVAVAIVEPEGPPISPPEAVAIVRQVLEEQPRRSAYLEVDVTPERISASREVLRYVPVPYALDWGFYSYYGVYAQPAYPYPYFDPYFDPYYGSYPWFDAYGAVVTHETDVVYFNNVGRIELRAGRRRSEIRIWDVFGEERMQLYAPDARAARRFVDAIGVLEQARSGADRSPPGPWRAEPD